jgi:type II secretion system protein N
VKHRLLKIAKWVGYPLFDLVCFAVFAVLTFPFDKAKESIVAQFNAQQRATNGHDQLTIGEMSGYWLTGVKVKEITFLMGNADPKKPPTEIKVDEVEANVSLLGLIAGNKDFSFKATAFDGEISGSYEMNGKDRAVEVNFDGVDIGKLEPLTAVIGIPWEGRLHGTVKLTMPEGKASKGNGEVALELKGVALGDGKAKVKTPMGEMPLPRTALGDLTLTGEAKDGTLKITKLGATGKDIELAGEGVVRMRELATESLLEVGLRLKFADAYRNKNGMTLALFGAPDQKFPPPLFEGVPLGARGDKQVKDAKRPDGYYGFVVRGQLGHPEFLPSPGGGPPPSSLAPQATAGAGKPVIAPPPAITNTLEPPAVLPNARPGLHQQ